MSATTRKLAYSIVDAFAAEPYTGNPAGVLILEEPLTEQEMIKIAREINLAETAFAVPRPDAQYDLRWFTPLAEETFCGHATLATAHILLSRSPAAEYAFHTLSGVLRARTLPTGEIALDLPVDDIQPIPPASDEWARCETALGDALGDADVRLVRAVRGRLDVLLELEIPDGVNLMDLEVRDAPFTSLSKRGVILTTALPAPSTSSNTHVHIHSRVFSPADGMPEDPVTGSAHCTLAPFYAPRFAEASGVPVSSFTLRATQGSRARHGALAAVWDGRAATAGGRVQVRGRAFTGEPPSLCVHITFIHR